MEAAAAIAFAGLFKLLNKGIIRRDEIVVVNCSGHTFPVEKHLLGDEWTQTVAVPEAASQQPPLKVEGLLGSLEQIDPRVRSIAILEDDPQSALLLRRILQAQGKYHIFEAHDGAEGFEMIQRERPDLILLDLMMPGMDGFQVLEALKADEELSKVPVIVVTAKELTAAERERLSGQIETLMQKGDFTDEDLLKEIRKRTA
jgi:threonine synthase